MILNCMSRGNKNMVDFSPCRNTGEDTCILLNLFKGKRRKRRDLDTVIGGQEGISPELEEKIHEMQASEIEIK